MKKRLILAIVAIFILSINLYALEPKVDNKKDILQDSLLTKDNKYYKKVKELLENGNIDKALEYLDSIDLKANSNKINSQIFSLKAILYIAKKEFTKAKEAFEESIKLDKNINNLFYYAKFLQENNQLQKAEKLYEQILKDFNVTKEKKAGILNNLGLLYKKQNSLNKAEELFIEALNIYKTLAKENSNAYNSDLADILNNLGNLYLKQNRLSKVEEYYNEALNIYQNLAKSNPSAYNYYVSTIYNNLVILYMKKKALNKAKETYLKALKIRRALAKDNLNAYDIEYAKTLIMGVGLLN